MFHCHGNHRESLRPNVTGYLAWRKLVGVEPTCDTECPTLVLKTRPSTGQD